MASDTSTKLSFAETGPSSPVVDSMRVDQVTPGAKAGMTVRLILAILVAFIMLIPVIWMAMTAFNRVRRTPRRRPKSFLSHRSTVLSASLPIGPSCRPALATQQKRNRPDVL